MEEMEGREPVNPQNKVLGWGVAMLMALSAAVIALALQEKPAVTVKVEPAPAPPPPPPPNPVIVPSRVGPPKPLPRPEPAAQQTKPADLTEIDIHLILNKIREGDLLALKGDMNAAKLAWGEARKRGFGLWVVHEALGDSYTRLKMEDDALREYALAEELLVGEPEALRRSVGYKRAALLRHLGHEEKALLSYLNASGKVIPEAYIRSLVSNSPKRAHLMEILWDHAETVDPRFYKLYADLAGDTPEAARAMARFFRLAAPWDAHNNQQIIRRLQQHKLIDEAIEVCRAWARAEPNDTRPYREIGNLLRGQGRIEEAIVAYSSMVDVRPGDINAHSTLGGILREFKRYDDAIAQYERCRDMRPEDPGWEQSIAMVNVEKGDFKAVQASVERLRNHKWGRPSDGIPHTILNRLGPIYLRQLDLARRKGDKAEVAVIRRAMAEIGMQEYGLFDLKITLSWDARTDVDLDVIEPNGDHIYHGNTVSSAGGRYQQDVLSDPGFGPETYTLANAPPGTYRIGVHLHGTTPASGKVVVMLFEETPRQSRREYSFRIDQTNSQIYFPDLYITK